MSCRRLIYTYFMYSFGVLSSSVDIVNTKVEYIRRGSTHLFHYQMPSLPYCLSRQVDLAYA